MNAYRTLRIWIATTLVTVVLSACTSSGSSRGPLTRLGDSVISGVGATPTSTRYQGDAAALDEISTFSREEEYHLGRAVAARVLMKYPPVTDEKMNRYVSLVGQSLAIFSQLPNTFGGYHFGVLDSQELNAVSAPGGFVFITKGLLERLPDEEALAAVLAHEVSHVVRRHGVRSISEDSARGALATLGLLAGGLSCDLVLTEAAVVFGAVVDEIVDALLEKGYSREFEFEADRDATLLLAGAGYEEAGMRELLAVLEGAEPVSAGGWFSTHPSVRDRQDSLPWAVSDVDPAAQAAPAGEGSAIRAARFRAIVPTWRQ